VSHLVLTTFGPSAVGRVSSRRPPARRATSTNRGLLDVVRTNPANLELRSELKKQS